MKNAKFKAVVHPFLICIFKSAFASTKYFTVSILLSVLEYVAANIKAVVSFLFCIFKSAFASTKYFTISKFPNIDAIWREDHLCELTAETLYSDISNFEISFTFLYFSNIDNKLHFSNVIFGVT